MSLFGNILAKLGIGKDQPVTPNETSGITPPPSDTTPVSSDMPIASDTGAAAPQAMSQVDVAAKLDTLAASHAEKLNWRRSIVDLLKLLDMDSSLSARQALAKELNCPSEKMDDSAQMNMWLHKAVLQKLSENGGNVPADLLD